MERMPFNSAKLPHPVRRYNVYLHDLWLGETEAVSAEKAINNVLWTHNLHMILTESEKDELYAVEAA